MGSGGVNNYTAKFSTMIFIIDSNWISLKHFVIGFLRILERSNYLLVSMFDMNFDILQAFLPGIYVLVNKKKKHSSNLNLQSSTLGLVQGQGFLDLQ